MLPARVKTMLSGSETVIGSVAVAPPSVTVSVTVPGETGSTKNEPKTIVIGMVTDGPPLSAISPVVALTA